MNNANSTKDAAYCTPEVQIKRTKDTPKRSVRVDFIFYIYLLFILF